jgi:UDP-N-acetylmuramoyl-tripeptide--D-alanyl-D-alanine ligase
MEDRKLFPHACDLSLGDLAEVTGGVLRLAAMPPRDGEMSSVERIVTDPTAIQPGDVYWAIPLPNNKHSGGDFTYEALMRGAAGVVSDRAVEPLAGRWSIEVSDPRVALWELARWKRSRFCGAMIGICGGASTKMTAAMIDCILRTRLTGTSAVQHAHEGSAAAAARIPLALLAIDCCDDYAVLEMPAADAGGDDGAARLCRPRFAVALPGMKALATGEHKLLATLSEDGCALLCGDDAGARRLAAQTRAKVIWYGRGANCDVCASNVRYSQGCLSFEVDGQSIRLAVWGRHHLHAALAAYATARQFAFAPEEIAAALTGFLPPRDCCEVSNEAGLTIIEEHAFDGAPSLASAMSLLCETPAPGRRFAVFGNLDGGQLADRAALREFGDEVASRYAADRLIACGPYARDVVTGARDAGMPAAHTRLCTGFDEAVDYLADETEQGDVLLFQAAPREAVRQFIDKRTAKRPLRRVA